MNKPRLCFLFLLFMACAPAIAGEAAATNQTALLDALLFNAQQYATTEAKLIAKRKAREELFAMGAEGFDFLLRRVYIPNIPLQMLADEAVNRLSAEQAAPVLLNALDDPHTEVRVMAVYWLGLFRTPQHTARVLPMLEDADARRMAIRTLGKWRAREALDKAIAFLDSDDERLRIAAVNALRDIGDCRAAPALVAALDDPVFTVRKTASRALSCLGRDIDRMLLAALPGATTRAKRELITLLAHRKTPGAIAALRECLDDPDGAVQVEAARALLPLEPRDAPKWLRDCGIDLPPGG